jgi:RND family efflux transporter MFP subunit
MTNENNDSLDFNKEVNRGEQSRLNPDSDQAPPLEVGFDSKKGARKDGKKGNEDVASHKASKPHLFFFLAIIGAVIVVIFFAGLIPKIGQSVDLNKEHQETVDAIPNVHVIVAKPAARTESITLPGNIGAMQYATIYARVDGYLKTRYVDIGDDVKTGQLLAEIETPTVDQAVLQAAAALQEARAKLKNEQANLDQAQEKVKSADAEVEKLRADVDYSRITASRWENLVERGAVSEQSRDEKVRMLESTSSGLEMQKANQKAAVAAVVAARATVAMAAAAIQAKLADYNKERAQQSFQKVTAPFDGIITLRKVDPGALITSGSSSSTLELFQLAKVDVLRIYVAVPQRIARFLKAGMDADIMPSEFPDRKFIGKVTNVSGALDSNTRTRQTEIHVKNLDHALLPGMYAEIKLTTLREAPWIRVPGTTLVVRPNGQFVALVKDEKVHYQKITIGRDYGDEVEVRTGLKGDEEVVISPSDDLLEGQKVKAILDKKDDGT